MHHKAHCLLIPLLPHKHQTGSHSITGPRGVKLSEIAMIENRSAVDPDSYENLHTLGSQAIMIRRSKLRRSFRRVVAWSPCAVDRLA